MANNSSHTTEYKVLARVLLVLIFLTFLTISITSFNLAAFTVTIALLIAGVKGFFGVVLFHAFEVRKFAAQNFGKYGFCAFHSNCSHYIH